MVEKSGEHSEGRSRKRRRSAMAGRPYHVSGFLGMVNVEEVSVSSSDPCKAQSSPIALYTAD